MVRRNPSQYDWKKLLFDETFLTSSFEVRSKRKIDAIVVHHAVVLDRNPKTDDGVSTVHQIFKSSGTSTHYAVEEKYVRQMVNDKDVAWAAGSPAANERTISIEHVNTTLDEPGTANDYKVSTQTWKTGARLVAYLHAAYIGKPVKNVTVRKHSSYYATACPGPYLDRIWDQYFAEVVRVYNSISVVSKPIPVIKPPKVAKPSKRHPLVKPWVLPAGHYYGDITGPVQSHGGFYENERDEVRNIQAWFIYHGCVPGVKPDKWLNHKTLTGQWRSPTTAACRRWFAKAAPQEPIHTAIYADDYKRLVRK